MTNTNKEKNSIIYEMNTMGYGKYKNLLILIAAFLGLVTILSVMSLYAANRFEKATQEIEVVAQQGVLVQQLSKNLLDVNLYLDEALKNNPVVDNTVKFETLSQTTLYRIEEIKQQQAIFTQSLEAMKNGGKVQILNGQTIEISAITSQELQKIISNIEQVWTPYVGLLNNFSTDVSRGAIKKETSDYLVDYTRLYNQPLQAELDDIGTGLALSAKQQANILKVVQIIGVVVAIGLFIALIFGALRQLMSNDKLLEAARRETTEIMTTVNTGLFLLDKDLNIGSQYSNALEGIMGTKRLAGENLATVLRNRISEKDLEVTRQFIAQLYNPRVKENLVNDLNPLNKVLFHDEQSTKNRYLDFKFSRVYEDKNIARILVNVNDISDAVLLEQRLEKERAQNDLQIEMLATILNISPTVIQEFIRNTMDRITKINNILKNPGSSQVELESKLRSIYREMHSLKGEASALKLHNFTKIATEAEDKMQALYGKATLSGNDFLPLTIHLDELLTLANLISQLGERITQAANQMQVSTHNPLKTEVTLTQEAVQDMQVANYYREFAQDIATRQDKKVLVDIIGDEFAHIPSHLANMVKEMSIQILRNAIAHGIELPHERVANGKDEAGTVSMRIYQTDKELMLVIKDDGRGINYDAVRAKLVAQGLYTTEEAKQLTEAQLINVLFTSGFSTKDSVDEDAGRGVGLDVIKARIQEAHGKLNVTSKADQGTHFTITLPLA